MGPPMAHHFPNRNDHLGGWWGTLMAVMVEDGGRWWQCLEISAGDILM